MNYVVNKLVFFRFISGLILIIISSFLALYFVKYQFGGYDLSPIIDLSWRLSNSEMPGRDFINTIPPIIIVFLRIESFFGFSWFDLTILNILAVILCYIFLGSYKDIVDRPLLYSFFIPMILCYPLIYTNHIWHSSVSQYISIIFCFSVYSCLHELNRNSNYTYYLFLMFMASLLLVAAKQNVAFPFIFTTIFYISLSRVSNKISCLAIIVFGAISGILLLVYFFNFSFEGLFYSYYAVLGRSSPSREMLGAVFSISTNQFLFLSIIIFFGFLLKIIINVKTKFYEENRLYLIICAFVSFVPVLTDWDSKFNNISLPFFIFSYFYYDPVISNVKKNSCLKSNLFLINRIDFITLLMIFTYIVAIFGGYTRERMKNVGPFYQTPAEIEIKEGYFSGLVTGQNFNTILQEIKAVKYEFPSRKLFFGPRIEFGYLLTKSKSPAGMPLWWHPGTSYLIKDEDIIVENFVKNNFDILIFSKSDRTRMPYKIINFINSKYIKIGDYRKIDVYQSILPHRQ